VQILGYLSRTHKGLEEETRMKTGICETCIHNKGTVSTKEPSPKVIYCDLADVGKPADVMEFISEDLDRCAFWKAPTPRYIKEWKKKI